MEKPTNGHAYCVSKLPTPSIGPLANNENPINGQLSCSSGSKRRRIG
jgi:hypothetical protein